MLWQESHRSKAPKDRRQQDTERIAFELYQNRLLLSKPGDERSDWQKASQIVRNPIRTTLFASNRPLIKLRKPTAKVGKFIVRDIPEWLLFSLPKLEWMKLIAVPLIIAGAGSVISGQVQREANQNSALKAYFDQLEKLTFDRELLAAKPNTGAIPLARGRTVAALRELDYKRKQQLLAFLQASNFTRAEGENKRDEKREPLISFRRQNLSNLDLHGFDLSGMDFEKTNLYRTDLHSANLNGAIFYDANLEGANLIDANLIDANLEGANLEGAKLKDANFYAARFYHADLSTARIEGAYLYDANLMDADLSGAFLFYADLRGTNLINANLRGTTLGYVNLIGANLNGADLSNANLQGADLRGANLLNANLLNANLEGADFSSADATGLELRKGYICRTQLPEMIISIDSYRDCGQLYDNWVLEQQH
jgi:uncharacterized protein YjbI with pentapeptide repeats